MLVNSKFWKKWFPKKEWNEDEVKMANEHLNPYPSIRDPGQETMKDFDMNKYYGTWYQMKSPNRNWGPFGPKCIRHTYTPIPK